MVQSRFRGLRWESVEEIGESNVAKAVALSGIEALGTSPDAQHPLVRLLRRTRVPRHPDPAASAHAEAKYLLQAASEVEHQFIVQYLYAVFSLDLVAGGAVAEQCRTHLQEIAEEEMGHLLSVQNALLLINAPPYFERERNPPPEPQPFPLILEPVGLPFISRFLVAESPLDAVLPDDLGDLKKTIEHVGALYAMLYWLFQDSDAPQEPWMLPSLPFPSGQHLKPEDYNADTSRVGNLLNSAADWMATGGIHVLPPLTPALDTPAKMADAARRALYDIALQGEGPVEAGADPPKETSHYHRLLALYTSIKEASPGLKLALDVPVNPHTEPTGATPPEEEPGLITDRVALLHARLFNLRYAMLLLEIAVSVMTPRSKVVDNQPVKRRLALRAIRIGMRRSVGALSRKLATLPLKAGQGGAAPPFAAAPYFIPPDLFPDNERQGWETLLRLIDESRALIDGAGGDLSPEMISLRQADEEFRSFVLARIGEFA